MYTLMSIKESILKQLPDAEVEIHNPRQDNEHFLCSVRSNTFKGKNKIEQHRMVYKALEKEFKEGLHSLSLKTQVKEHE